jgi:integrase
MLTIYRRHLKACKHREEGRAYRRCQCPIWVDGFLGVEEIRQSLNVRDWQKASDQIHKWEARGTRKEKIDIPVAIPYACAEFLRDAKARELRRPTLYKYRLLFRRLRDFGKHHGLRFITELDVAQIRHFRASWPDHNLSALKKLERLRALFNFCVSNKWLSENPARKEQLKNPKIEQPPTLPLSRDEVANIIAACDRYPDRANSVRLKALVLLLRYSGLRIRDAVTLSADRIYEGKLFLYTAKTGVAVWCPLPASALIALKAIPRKGAHFFWTGESKPKSCVGDWQRSLRTLFQLSGVPDAHAHRFRDTFSVELLQAGVPLERVSILLGHRSVKVTEKHYAAWVLARQEQLEADVRRSWDVDLLAFAERKTRGTPEVHDENRLN